MDKKQFDEFLGGSVELPSDVQIVKLAAARASEIAAMTYSIDNPQQTKLVFQKLPVHMRRRVMSHNARRMPRRLREAHISQMTKSGLPPKSKRPSRKYRRRPQKLLDEYNRRQRDRVWLETHIWHAKRFRMIERWGHKIAERPNDKSYRACYRATANHCMIQDISYYNCLEIKGPGELLRAKLRSHCNQNELTFGARTYLQGSRQGNVMFFKKNGYPANPIGNVNFLWKPGEEESKTIWMWVHPLIYRSFLDEIVDSFEFKGVPGSEFDDRVIQEKSFYTYENDESCTMTNLRHSLGRFRLTGPLSLAILTHALRMPALSSKRTTVVVKETDCSTTSQEVCGSNGVSSMDVDAVEETSDWFETFYREPANCEAFVVQRDTFEALRTLKSPNQLPPNSVMAFTVLDPRFFLPPKRTKRILTDDYYVKIPMPASLAHHSPIWEPSVRKSVKADCKSTHDINKLRSECLVPGVGNDDQFDEKVISKVPVIFMQNPGCYAVRKSIGFTSGIDVVIPAGWSMPFWQACIYRCARAGGLRESRSMALEGLDLRSPETHQPDIPAYVEEAFSTMAELRAKYFRYPPNRRVNYAKFRISSPFYCEWKILMREWTASENFHVLRDRKSLELLNDALSSENHWRGKDKGVNGSKIVAGKSGGSFDRCSFADFKCLVPVKISLEGKGRPTNYAIICAPSQADLETRSSKTKWAGPVQKLMPDPNKHERRALRKNHRLQLKRLNRRRRHCRRLAADTADSLQLEKRPGNSSKPPIDKNQALKKNYREKMEALYLPQCTTVRKSCDRDVMGYVTRGDFSFSEARGIGMGYVTVDSLIGLIEAKSNAVLVRNTQTRQYRFAIIEVLSHCR